jgi:hypothetical protein
MPLSVAMGDKKPPRSDKELLKRYAEGERDFRGIDISGAELNFANLSKANFTGANLNGANLRGADLGLADLSGAGLMDASLVLAQLVGANLRGADLGLADLRNTELLDCNLDRAVLYRTALDENADLLSAGWQTLNISGKTYHREAVECGVELLPIGMGNRLTQIATERTNLENILMQTQSRLNELKTFLKESKGKGKVFLSHSAADKPIVEQIKKRLELNGVSTWYDLDQLDIGDPILDMITKGIDESVFVAAFLSKSSINSKWVQVELRIAFEKSRDGNAIFLPILLEGVKDSMIPGYLRGLIYADLRNGSNEQLDDVVNKLLRAIARLYRSK